MGPSMSECLVVLKRKQIELPNNKTKCQYDIVTEGMIYELKFIQSFVQKFINGIIQEPIQVEQRSETPIFSISNKSVINNLNQLQQFMKLDSINERLCSEQCLQLSDEDRQLLQSIIISDLTLPLNIVKAQVELTLSQESHDSRISFIQGSDIYRVMEQIIKNPPTKYQQEEEYKINEMMGVETEQEVPLHLLYQPDIKQLEQLNASEIESISQKCLSQFSRDESLIFEYHSKRYPAAHQPMQLKHPEDTEEDKQSGETLNSDGEIYLLKEVGTGERYSTWIAGESKSGRVEKLMVKILNQKQLEIGNSLALIKHEQEILNKIGKDSVAIEMRDNWKVQVEGQMMCQYYSYKINNGIQLVEYLNQLQSYSSLKWTKYIFRKIIIALQKLHSKRIAHLGLSLDSIRIEFSDNQQEMNIKFTDLRLAHYYGENTIVDMSVQFHEDRYRPPEMERFLIENFNAEQYDVFAAGNILLVLLYSGFRNSNGSVKPLSAECYDKLIYQKRQQFWTAFFTQIKHDQSQHQSAVLQDLVEGMLNADLTDRLTLQRVLDHDWFKSDDELTSEARYLEITHSRTQGEEKLLHSKVYDKTKTIHVKTKEPTPTKLESEEVQIKDFHIIEAVLRVFGSVSAILGADKCSHLIRTQFDYTRAPEKMMIQKGISTEGMDHPEQITREGINFGILGEIAVKALLLNCIAHYNLGDLETKVEDFLNDNTIWTLLALNIDIDLPKEGDTIKEMIDAKRAQMKKNILYNRDKPEIFKTLEMIIEIRQSIDHVPPSQHFKAYLGMVFSEHQADLESVFCEMKPLFIIFYALATQESISQIYDNNTFKPVLQAHYALDIFKVAKKEEVSSSKVNVTLENAESPAYPKIHDGLTQSASYSDRKQLPSQFEQLHLHSQKNAITENSKDNMIEPSYREQSIKGSRFYY